VATWSFTAGRNAAAPTAVAIRVHGVVQGQPVAGSVVYFAHDRTAVLRADTLPDIASAVYEVWVIKPGAPPHGAGFLTRQPDGAWAAALDVPTGTAEIAATIEPPGGSVSPTGPTVLTGRLGA
jgi:hypothetical protein